MKMQRKFNTFILVIATLLFVGCTALKPQSQSAAVLTGKWEETWGVGEQTNVNYADVYIISVDKQGKASIVCPQRKNYVFEQVNFDGKKITTHLLIKDLKYGAGDAWVDYSLELQDDKKVFKGTALTKAGKKASIIWKKIAD